MAVNAAMRTGLDRISAIRSFQSGTMSIDINRSNVTGSNAMAVPSQLLPTSTTSRSSPVAAAFAATGESGVVFGLTYAFAQPVAAQSSDAMATHTAARRHNPPRRPMGPSVIEATTDLVGGRGYGPGHQVGHQVHLRSGQLEQSNVSEILEVAVFGKGVEPRKVLEL